MPPREGQGRRDRKYPRNSRQYTGYKSWEDRRLDPFAYPDAATWEEHKALYGLNALEAPDYSQDDVVITAPPDSRPHRDRGRTGQARPNRRLCKHEIKAAGVIFYQCRPSKGLLLLRPLGKNHGKGWGDFGGKAETGETPRDTAIREAYEEINGRLSLEYLGSHVSRNYTYIAMSRYALFTCELPLEFDYTTIEPGELHPDVTLRGTPAGDRYYQEHQREIRLFSPNQVREFFLTQGEQGVADPEKVLHRRLPRFAVKSVIDFVEVL